MIHAVLNNQLTDSAFTADPVFGIQIPEHCPGVPDGLLHPRNTWPSKQAYDRKAKELAHQFIKNFEKYAAALAAPIREAGPRM